VATNDHRNCFFFVAPILLSHLLFVWSGLWYLSRPLKNKFNKIYKILALSRVQEYKILASSRVEEYKICLCEIRMFKCSLLSRLAIGPYFDYTSLSSISYTFHSIMIHPWIVDSLNYYYYIISRHFLNSYPIKLLSLDIRLSLTGNKQQHT